jgi:hypothetical protein
MKVVINKCFGGFGISHKAVMLYAKLKGFKVYPFSEARDTKGNLDYHNFVPWDGRGEQPFSLHYAKSPLEKGKYKDDAYFSPRDIERNDPELIRVVEQLKSKANGNLAELSIVKIPDGVEWEIDDYDGRESVHEKHRVWS